MISDQFNPDPSDLSNETIQRLFYRQIKSLSVRQESLNEKMDTFDVQFSDEWF